MNYPRFAETIRQKLIHRMYSHPFRWQEDVRTIFYNAFTYVFLVSKLLGAAIMNYFTRFQVL